MKPKFPNIPYGTTPVRAIAPSWFRELRDFCEWAADHPRGDGYTILNTGDGTLQARRATGGGSGGSVTFPCYRVTKNNDGTLDVTGGWLNRNGEFVRVSGVTGIQPRGGYLCVCSTPDVSGKWSDPEFRIQQQPEPDAYPVAEIEVQNDSFSIVQYPVAVAFILLVKQCPIAEF